MKPPAFQYARPASLDEALALLGANPDAKVLAGGQSLVPLLSMRLVAPRLVVDVNGIAELAYVRTTATQDAGSGPPGVHVGALARHADVEADPDAARVQPLLGDALRLVAHPTIRNRGTTVGSIVHADAAAEMPAVLALLGGHLTVASQEGRRTIPHDELFVGPLETSLRHGELAVEAFFPALPAGCGVAIDEVARRHGDYALCGVAVLVELSSSPDEPPSSVRAGYLSVCDVPTVVDLSGAYRGGLRDDAHAAAADLALSRLDPGDDIHATAAYRGQLVRTLTRRTVEAAYADGRTRLLAGSPR
jgi:CO/xanthine dehydrogenase FAD-binding subunit